ncbi:MAG TPA: hypothetical protein VJ829_03265 [Candidatus Binatia bacterium]|nr:hypothetical protein [Candidatus Binatia bacterium]
MEILIGLLALGVSIVGLFTRTDVLLTEIRDLLVEIRDDFRR